MNCRLMCFRGAVCSETEKGVQIGLGLDVEGDRNGVQNGWWRLGSDRCVGELWCGFVMVLVSGNVANDDGIA